MRFSQVMSPSSKPRRMWVPSLWAGCVHTPGESGQVGMVKVQAVPAAQADLTPSAGFHPPRGRGGGCQSRHASPLILGAEGEVGRSSSQIGQAQLTIGLTDGHWHCRASHLIWPMRETPQPPPRGRGRTTISLALEAQCRLQVSVSMEGSANWE